MEKERRRHEASAMFGGAVSPAISRCRSGGLEGTGFDKKIFFRSGRGPESRAVYVTIFFFPESEFLLMALLYILELYITISENFMYLSENI
ncbi:hypothetical protein KXS07_36415 [Inquilinus limosus]|uniref:hypothetical protein n=1 Tax=Inquilinus limosus TaxID=171674 RepID=UPI003F1430FA